MIDREYIVVIVEDYRYIKSIEARCDSLENAQLFIHENAYLLKKGLSFKINEVVVIKEK